MEHQPETTPPSDPLHALRGAYVLGSCVRRNDLDVDVRLGTLQVFEASPDPDAGAGQWTLVLPAEQDARRSIIIDVASRLGLLPVRFAPSFKDALDHEAAMVLVADTNALLHGILAQALRVRAGRATHVAVADQAFMEVHRQREQAYAKRLAKAPAEGPQPPGGIPVDQLWAARAERATYLAAARRTLERLQAMGYVTHVARPPDAMVRYLGGSKGGVESDEGSPDQDFGSNALRDRLMLEAAAQHRIKMPGVQVWFVTGDALLAEQAKMEGLNVGFAWRCEKIAPPLLASPFFNAHTLEFERVRIQDFLDELVWSCEVVTLQQAHKDTRLVGRLPTGKRERALAAMKEVNHGIVWGENAAAPLPDDPSSGLPRKAPAAERLIGRLLDLVAGSMETPGDVEKRSDAYLRALGWIDGAGVPTTKGRGLAQRWLEQRDDVLAWVAWMADAAQDIAQLPKLAELLGWLKKNPGATDKDLQALSKESATTVEGQLRMAHAFGLAVRIANKNWPVALASDTDADEAVLTAIRTLVHADLSVRAANIAQTFLSILLSKTGDADSVPGLSLPAFRGTLVRLLEKRWIRLSGGSPASSNAKLRVLVQGSESKPETRDVDLGRGDFLVPGTPCVVATLLEDR